MLARILSVAEFYDSAVSARPHRDALPEEEVLQMVRGGAGTLFDPEVAELFVAEPPTAENLHPLNRVVPGPPE